MNQPSARSSSLFFHNSLCLQCRISAQQSSGSMTWSCFKPLHTHVRPHQLHHTHILRQRTAWRLKSCCERCFLSANTDTFLHLILEWEKKQKQPQISVRTSVQGSCWEEVPQWVWEPSWWLISTWWWVSGSRRGSLQVVSGLVLWLSGGKVVLQEGLDVLEGGPLIWLFLPTEPHHFV